MHVSIDSGLRRVSPDQRGQSPTKSTVVLCVVPFPRQVFYRHRILNPLELPSKFRFARLGLSVGDKIRVQLSLSGSLIRIVGNAFDINTYPLTIGFALKMG